VSADDPIQRLIRQIEDTKTELEAALADPALVSDRIKNAAVNRRWSGLQIAFGLVDRYRAAQATVSDAEEMLAAGDEDARLFLKEAQDEIDTIVPELREAMVETDPNDDRDVILEIRAAAGGDEAGLFARDLLDVYTKYAGSRGFKTELMESNPSESGGFKEVSLAIKGQGAFSVFKHEGGVHRVQRVPATESQGRIHTSTATVAVMPEVEDVEVHVDKNDLKIDVYRSTGPGGQSVNTTDSAVRITHLPTGLVVAIQDEKSQLQNRDKAMRVLRARLYERAMEEQMAQLSAERRAQQGGGDRSEKVRTYNYPQNRVTDHRVNVNAQLREQVLEGKLHTLTEALQAEERRRRLSEMTESDA
jgi:peptide chain release factor 1